MAAWPSAIAVVQPRGDCGDRDHEAQVEEQLERRRDAVRLVRIARDTAPVLCVAMAVPVRVRVTHRGDHRPTCGPFFTRPRSGRKAGAPR